jgi:hypothetical protein
MRALTYVEIDIPAFTQNSPPDSPPLETTFRFAIATAYLPADIEAIPSIKEVSLTPATVSLGENLGQRATLDVTFQDHKYVFAGEAFESGTFWGKFRARYGLTLAGRPVRLIRGLLGQTLAEMETRHFIIESTAGPRHGEFTLIGKDILKLADGDRAQAPRFSTGFLVADITNVATSATLSPAGIGAAEYPASGHVAIGGNEIAAFSRSGDVLTLTRGQLGTPASAHNAQDRVQLVLRYVGVDPADIIRDLLVNYAAVPASYILLANWQGETAAFLARVYTATIAEPTAVTALVSELIEQAALAIWWDEVKPELRLVVLRGVAPSAQQFDEDTMMAGSFDAAEQPAKRISQIATYFGQINPLKSLTDADNFRSSAVTFDTESAGDYSAPAIKTIHSRWIPALGRSVADRVNAIQLGRFHQPPRKFSFATLRYAGDAPVLGQGYNIRSPWLQDSAGAPVDVPVQIVRLDPQADRFAAEAEEVQFHVPVEDLSNRQIIVDANINNVNLRSAHDSLYPPIADGDSPKPTIICTVNAGVIVGSGSTASPAFDVGSWPAGVTINLVVRGRLEGMGGHGGAGGGENGFSGEVGGPALRARYAISLDIVGGEIWGGGGGGGGGAADFFQGQSHGGGGGGGGAGQLGGDPGAGGPGFVHPDGSPGQPGTATAGGAGGASGGGSAGAGGAGGGPGLAGATGGSAFGFGGAGGSPGAAIDGISFVTITAGPGDRRGPEIN